MRLLRALMSAASGLLFAALVPFPLWYAQNFVLHLLWQAATPPSPRSFAGLSVFSAVLVLGGAAVALLSFRRRFAERRGPLLGLAVGICLGALPRLLPFSTDEPRPRRPSEPRVKLAVTAAGEADDGLHRLGHAAEMYYEYDSTKPSGRHTFPSSVDWTPADLPCGYPNRQYPVRPELWQQPTWRALRFSVTEPSRVQYRMEATRTEGGANVAVVQARFDEQCDGNVALKERRIVFLGRDRLIPLAAYQR